MFRNKRFGSLFAIVSERSDDLKRIFEGRDIAIARSGNDGESVSVACEGVAIEFWQDRNRAIFADVIFPCDQFRGIDGGVSKTYTALLIHFMADCFDLELAPYRHQFCDEGWAVDPPEAQIAGLMGDLELLVSKVLFDQRVRDLAAAYVSGADRGYNQAVSFGESD